MASGAFSASLVMFDPLSSSKRQTIMPQGSYRISPSLWSTPSLLSPLRVSAARRPLLVNVQENSLHSPKQLLYRRNTSRMVSNVSSNDAAVESEIVFFDGGVHYGDLLTNLVFGLTLVWLPLTLAAVFRGLFLRYRFTNLRITIQSGLLGDDRKDFSYDVVKDVKVVPRFIGEWGDMAIELKDGTKVDVRCVPKFREIAKYIQERAGQNASDSSNLSATGTSRIPKKGFS